MFLALAPTTNFALIATNGLVSHSITGGEYALASLDSKQRTEIEDASFQRPPTSGSIVKVEQ